VGGSVGVSSPSVGRPRAAQWGDRELHTAHSLGRGRGPSGGEPPRPLGPISTQWAAHWVPHWDSGT